jgi:two-component system chemotaxis response regulator CheB
MPLWALEAVDADHIAPADKLADLLVALAGEAAGPFRPASDHLRLEVEIAAGGRLGSGKLLQIASPSPLSCPECHGVLSEVRGSRPLRYRCQIGHAYTAEHLAAFVDEIDEALGIAMRVMEERVTLVERMARDARDSGRMAVAELYEARVDEYRRYASTLRDAAVASLRLGRASREQDL